MYVITVHWETHTIQSIRKNLNQIIFRSYRPVVVPGRSEEEDAYLVKRSKGEVHEKNGALEPLLNSLPSIDSPQIVHLYHLTPQQPKNGASKRVRDAKTKKFASNVHKRGIVDINANAKDKEKFTVGPVVLAFFIFVVIGSSFLQFIRALSSSSR